MKKTKVRKIEVIVKGNFEDTGYALYALLNQIDDNTLKEALESLSDERLKRIAQLVHGRLYQRF